jgi:hypothetical protein
MLMSVLLFETALLDPLYPLGKLWDGAGLVGLRKTPRGIRGVGYLSFELLSTWKVGRL